MGNLAVEWGYCPTVRLLDRCPSWHCRGPRSWALARLGRESRGALVLTRIPADPAEPITRHYPIGRSWSLEAMRALIGGGYLEIHRSAYDPDQLWAGDEDGRPRGLPFNARASYILGATTVGVILVGSPEAFGGEP